MQFAIINGSGALCDECLYVGKRLDGDGAVGMDLWYFEGAFAFSTEFDTGRIV